MQNLIMRGEDRRRQRALIEDLSRARLGLNPTVRTGEVVQMRRRSHAEQQSMQVA